MSEKRSLTVYIGRFSPFHNGHAEVLLRALRLSTKVLVIIGSARQPRRVKNPWTAAERADIIYKWYEEQRKLDPTLGMLWFESARDYPYNDNKWLIQVYELIARNHELGVIPYITGADRDRTSFYLKKFPSPKFILDLTEENERVSMFLTATSIREIYFGKYFNGQDLDDGKVDLLLKSFLPPTTLRYMLGFTSTDQYLNLVNEFNCIRDRKAARATYRWPIITQTVDAVVIQSGYVLLVRRAGYPGKGLWALPGGHIEEYEWMLDAAIRELKEESKLKVPEPVLYGSLQFDQRFEHPDRSEVGRVITQAFCFKLPDHLDKSGQVALPEVYGIVHDLGGELNDTDKAQWFPLSEVLEKMSDQLFDDHHSIIETFVDRLTTEKSDQRKDRA